MTTYLKRWLSGSRRFAPRTARLALERVEERDVPATLLALDSANNLLRFDSAAPTTIQATTAISGLAAGELVVGVDFRPRTGQLYAAAVSASGTGTAGRLFTVNALTGAATAVGAFTVPVADATASYGFDFNPTVDAIRVVNSADANFRLNPDNGAVLGTDTTLTPAGQQVDAVAYDRNFDGRLGAAGTTLYAINLTTGTLQTQGGVNQNPSPNTGALATVGALGVPFDANSFVGFDIGAAGAARGGDSFAVFDGNPAAGVASGLYRINLTTGAATLVGLVGTGATPLTGLAVVPSSAFGLGANGANGAQAAGDATLRLVDTATRGVLANVTPFVGYQGQVATAVVDVNRDSVLDLVAVASNNGHVKVFSGVDGSLLYSFLAFQGFNGSVSVAGGDVGGGAGGVADGFGDIIVGAGGVGVGGHVKAFSGANASQIQSFLAFQGFNGAISVAASDVDLDRTNFRDEIVVGAASNGHVKVFDGSSAAQLQSFLAFPLYTGGVSLAGGDVNGDGTGDIVIGTGAGTQGHIKTFNGRTNALISSFLSLPGATSGVSVGTADANKDGRLDILGTPLTGTVTSVAAFDPLTGTRFDSFTVATALLGAQVAGNRT